MYTSSSRSFWSPAQIEMESPDKCTVASVSERSYDQPTSVAEVLVLILDCGIGDPSNAVSILPVVPEIKTPAGRYLCTAEVIVWWSIVQLPQHFYYRAIKHMYNVT